ncbi:MAG: cyclic nucleotide-binding domain-containing protein [Alphaproteobacteria bacterium]|nr:cyclic nucleotide-binding domain-containing protein [Alphaproteobacteria bacterium]
MASDTSILERSAIQKGKVFIHAGDEISRAYVIQNGEVVAFTMQNDRKIEVSRFGPDSIIGELGLVSDEISLLSYETLTLCTVVTVTRQEFQKRLHKADKNVSTIMEHAVKKISYYENIETQKAVKAAEIDETAYLLMNNLLKGISHDRKMEYEDAILPHLNGLIKAIKSIKKSKKETMTVFDEEGNATEETEAPDISME